MKTICSLLSKYGRKKEIKLLRIIIAGVGLLCTPLMAQNPPCPVLTGVFYLDGNAWKPLKLMSASGAAGLGRTMHRYSTITYPNSALPITGVRPTFCGSGTMTTARNVLILRLTQNKDHCELQVSAVAASGGINMGYDPLDIRRVDVIPISDHSLQIVPQESLQPGQYLLVPPGPPTFLASRGYGFTVR
jgi:hypothetical protein